MLRAVSRITLGLLTYRFALALAVALLAACRPGGDAVVGSLKPCRIPGVDREVQCGAVSVPEDPGAPGARQIVVQYAIVPAIARNKQPDPVFVLAGGPGQAAIRLAGQVMPLMNSLNSRRDIVFIDQRGTGQSNPFECAREGNTVEAALEARQQLERLQECIKSFKGDPRLYATWIAVRDFDVVRAQLGAEQINLWGASYGTRAALEYLRQYPRHVRTAVLDGVAPPDMALPVSFALDSEAALTSLSRLCAADPRCLSQYPDFDARVAALLERAVSAPWIEVDHPLTGAREKLRLDSRALTSLLRGPLYSPSLAALLPFAVAEAANGHYGPLVSLTVSLAGRVQDNFAAGMHFAVICAEDLPKLRTRSEPAPIGRFGTVFADLYEQACAVMPTAPVPAAFYEVGPSAVPVLILSGGLDPATPPRHAEVVARKLGNATHLVAPNLAHGISGQGCAAQLITRFVREASAAALDGACLSAIPPPGFFRPLETNPTRSAPR